MRTIALDLGARKICLSEVADGKQVQSCTVRRLAELKPVLGPGTSPAQVAVEACREAWAVCATLKEWGHEPVLVDTTRSRQMGIGAHGRKTDEIDAKVLAMALYEKRIPKAHLLSEERQKSREMLSVRATLVDTMTELINAIRGHARALGTPLPGMDTGVFCGRVAAMKLGEALQMLIAPLLMVLSTVHQQLCEMDAKLEATVQSDPVMLRLMSVPGVGPVVAATFVSVIDDAGRFHDAHQVMSYLGLVPSENTTGGKRRLGSISKAGNSRARAMLVQAAHVILNSGGQDPLRQWGLNLLKRKGRRPAAVAIARRLAGILWAMMRDGATYNPKLVGEASADGLRCRALQVEVEAMAMQLVAAKSAKRQTRIARSQLLANEAANTVRGVMTAEVAPQPPPAKAPPAKAPPAKATPAKAPPAKARKRDKASQSRATA